MRLEFISQHQVSAVAAAHPVLWEVQDVARVEQSYYKFRRYAVLWRVYVCTAAHHRENFGRLLVSQKYSWRARELKFCQFWQTHRAAPVSMLRLSKDSSL
jgi:hypothetical protein